MSDREPPYETTELPRGDSEKFGYNAEPHKIIPPVPPPPSDAGSGAQDGGSDGGGASEGTAGKK